MPVYQWSLTTMRTTRALLNGHFPEAERLAEAARALQPERIERALGEHAGAVDPALGAGSAARAAGGVADLRSIGTRAWRWRGPG